MDLLSSSKPKESRPLRDLRPPRSFQRSLYYDIISHFIIARSSEIIQTLYPVTYACTVRSRGGLITRTVQRRNLSPKMDEIRCLAKHARITCLVVPTSKIAPSEREGGVATNKERLLPRRRVGEAAGPGVQISSPRPLFPFQLLNFLVP
jgi:hypothetical protein